MSTTVRLSNLQYSMLKVFTTERASFRLSIVEAGVFDQRPFASMLKRQYVSFERRTQSFYLTSTGRAAMIDFETRDILRKVATMQLTSYFNPKDYSNVIQLRRTG